jgi:type II secretory pathway pseudopilin PulG
VVIGILAAITIVSYTGITQRANYAREQSDMKNINDLIQLYYADNGQYPPEGNGQNGGWSGWSQAPNFISGLVPTYTSKLPQMPISSDSYNTYLYTSNGSDYKLIRISGSSGLPSVERVNNSLADPVRSVDYPTGAWGYWSSGDDNL